MPPEKYFKRVGSFKCPPKKMASTQARWTLLRMTCLFTPQDQNRCKQICEVAASTELLKK